MSSVENMKVGGPFFEGFVVVVILVRNDPGGLIRFGWYKVFVHGVEPIEHDSMHRNVRKM